MVVQCAGTELARRGHMTLLNWTGHTRWLVLILASDPRVQQVLAGIAEREGCRPLLATSELDGYNLLSERCDEIAFVILDLNAPGIDALTFRLWQLDAPRAAIIPTVVMSNRCLTDIELATLQPSRVVVNALTRHACRPLGSPPSGSMVLS